MEAQDIAQLEECKRQKGIYSLKLHETTKVNMNGKNWDVTRVHGGYIYYLPGYRTFSGYQPAISYFVEKGSE